MPHESGATHSTAADFVLPVVSNALPNLLAHSGNALLVLLQSLSSQRRQNPAQPFQRRRRARLHRLAYLVGNQSLQCQRALDG